MNYSARKPLGKLLRAVLDVQLYMYVSVSVMQFYSFYRDTFLFTSRVGFANVQGGLVFDDIISYFTSLQESFLYSLRASLQESTEGPYTGKANVFILRTFFWVGGRMVEGGHGVPEKEYIGQFIQYFDDLIYLFFFLHWGRQHSSVAQSQQRSRSGICNFTQIQQLTSDIDFLDVKSFY